MAVFQTTQSYASNVSVEYDQERGLYVGEMFSRGGLYRAEAFDMASVYRQIDTVLQNEYREMTHEVSRGRQRGFGSGMGRSVSIGDHETPIDRHRENGVPVITLRGSDARAKGLSLGDMVGAFDLSKLLLSLVQGQWLDALISALSIAFQEYLEKERSHESQEPVIFAATFGGVLITAASRSLLRKKLMLQKNKRIQIIMAHMRSHEKNREEASSVENVISRNLAGRIRDKKRLAEASWRARTSPQGQETIWRGKTVDLRERIKTKRNEAARMWVERAV